jgi:KaiC/GvpD/RAD55 family RecA-like ATPase
MIRTVPAGDLGLDVLLGGGFRLVARLADRASATVLVRGGAGAGKTLVGLHVALELGRALGGDVAVGCVEMLPSEYLAQIEAARPDIEQDRVTVLPAGSKSASGPRVYCGLLTELDPDAPDLVASLEALGRDVSAAGGKPVVFVVDSLIEGYGIGASIPRAGADAVMKFAAQGGYGLVLCEETQGAGASPWVFTADTVIELGVESRARGRWIEVRKHRFGASAAGRHELDLGGGGAHPAVFPEPHAWIAPEIQGVLREHGWEFSNERSTPSLVWHGALGPFSEQEPLEGTFTLVASPDVGLAHILALGLLPTGGQPGRELVIALDPLQTREIDSPGQKADVHHVPTAHGAARALRAFVERFARTFERGAGGRPTPTVRRILLGDLGIVLSANDAPAWAEATNVFANLVGKSGWGIPVIAYEGLREGSSSIADMDVRIQAERNASGSMVRATVMVRRRPKMPHVLAWPRDFEEAPLPEDLAHLDRLPRPRRETSR